MEYAREGIITNKMQQAANKHGAYTMCGELCAYKVMNERKEAA